MEWIGEEAVKNEAENAEKTETSTEEPKVDSGAKEESKKSGKDRVKEAMDSSSQKLKESMGDFTEEAKKQMNKQKEALSSFWDEFSAEVMSLSLFSSSWNRNWTSNRPRRRHQR